MAELTQVAAAARTPAERVLALAREYGITISVALVVFLVAYDNGGFGESTRDTLAIVLWWVLILCAGLGVWPLARTTRAAWVVGGLLTLFGLWTLLSVFWAADAAGAYAEFTRVMLYVAVFAVTVAASRRDNGPRWMDGLALAIAGVAVIALIGRFFPGTFEQEEIAQLISGGAARLSFPLGYWNGLAIFLALGIPLLLRAAVGSRGLLVRGAALAPIPGICGAIYLASSRAGVGSAIVGVGAFLLLTVRRWTATAAVAVAGAGGAAVILALSQRNALVNGPFGSSLVESQGRSAALIVFGVCLLSGILYAVGLRALEGRVHPSPVLGWIVAVLVAGLVVGGIAAAHPVRRFEAFKNPTINLSDTALIEQHLLSSSGNGRWQLWAAAVDEFESKPLHGGGAGSFEAWWAQKGSLPLFVQDAHSLYAETLGELGIVGFLLLMGALGVGLVVAGTRLRRVSPDQRLMLAAAGAAFVAFLVSAAVDWMWELTIVPVAAFVCLGVLVGPATVAGLRPRSVAATETRPQRALARYGVGVATIVIGWLLICAIAIPLLAGAKITGSQQAAERGDLSAAVDAAMAARSIQPWSAVPYQQLGLLEEEAGRYDTAEGWIQRAIHRDPSEWRLWLIRARLQTELGHIRAARRSLERCRALDPRAVACPAL